MSVITSLANLEKYIILIAFNTKFQSYEHEEFPLLLFYHINIKGVLPMSWVFQDGFARSVDMFSKSNNLIL